MPGCHSDAALICGVLVSQQQLCDTYHALQVSHDLKTSIETVRKLVEEGKERLAAILAQEGLIKDLRMSA